MFKTILKMATEAPAKKLKTSPPLIGTHNGTFHADEALAVYLLRLLPTYSNSPLLRTRDPAQLATCHTVVDVGGVYDHSTHRYDHHQNTFTSTSPPRATKLSSAGLVWLHFGRAIVAARTGLPETSSPDTETLFHKLYTDFVEPIDANDNGIAAYSPATLTQHGLAAGFKQFGITLPSLVADLNHAVDLPPPTGVPTGLTDAAILTRDGEALRPEQLPQAAEDARFQQASTLMGTSFLRKLALAHGKWLPARTTVAQAYAARGQVDASGSILQLTGGGVPWKEHLYAIEEEDEEEGGQVLFVLYPESGGDPGSKWRVQAVSKSADSFENRRGLRKEWRGVRDAELSGVSGIEGCVFVHAAGFIGGNATREGALEMARRSLVD